MKSEFQKLIDEGLALCRLEGMTFTRFKSKVTAMLTPPPKWSEDFWVMQYEMYASDQVGSTRTVERWASEHFQEFKIGENSCELKKKK